jgi:hypothetical protein
MSNEAILTLEALEQDLLVCALWGATNTAIPFSIFLKV